MISLSCPNDERRTQERGGRTLHALVRHRARRPAAERAFGRDGRLGRSGDRGRGGTGIREWCEVLRRRQVGATTGAELCEREWASARRGQCASSSGAAHRLRASSRRAQDVATDLVELVVAPHKDVATESRAVVVLDGIVLREERLVSRLLVLHN